MQKDTLMRDAARFFHAQLRTNANAASAIALLHEWGLQDDQLVQLGIGFHDENFQSLIDYLTKSKSYTVPQLFQAHLVEKSPTGRVYDKMRNSIVVPTIDLLGNVVCFDRYVMGSDQWYLSPSGTSFNRARELYSLNVAVQSKKKSVIVVSSFEDYFMLYGRGITNVVATYLPRITEEQLALLKGRFKVVMPFVAEYVNFSVCGRFCRTNGMFSDKISLQGYETPRRYLQKFGTYNLLDKMAEYEMLD